MGMEEKIADLIEGSLKRLRADLGLPDLGRISDQTVLYGNGSDLDSMAIVHLIVDLEGTLNREFGKDWILADDRALSRNRSPFRNVGSLKDFILELEPQL